MAATGSAQRMRSAGQQGAAIVHRYKIVLGTRGNAAYRRQRVHFPLPMCHAEYARWKPSSGFIFVSDERGFTNKEQSQLVRRGTA